MQTTSMKQPTTLAGALWRAAGRFINPPSISSRQRQVMRHLASLDNHLLADIGLGRDEIHDVIVNRAIPASRWLRG